MGKSFGILKTWNDWGPSKRVLLALCPSILSDFVVKGTWWLVLLWKERERKTSEHGEEILSNCNYLHGVHILCPFCFYCPASHTVLSSFSPFNLGPKSKVVGPQLWFIWARCWQLWKGFAPNWRLRDWKNWSSATRCLIKPSTQTLF